MHGGDWPIPVPAGGYARVFDDLCEHIGPITQPERDALLHGTATAFNGLDVEALRAQASFAAEDHPLR